MNKLYDRRPYQPYDGDENDFIDIENEFDDNESIYSMSDVYMSDSDDEFENDVKYNEYAKKTIDSKLVIRRPINVHNPNVQYKIGNHYYHGKDVDKDLKVAFKWYKKSALQGFPKAQAKLAQCYLKGEGVEKDVNESKKWSLKASRIDKTKSSDKKNVNKKLRYNPFLKKRIGGDISDYDTKEKRKDKLLRELAELGNDYAQYEIAMKYWIEIKSGFKNINERETWFDKTIHWLGYENVSKNMSEIKMWLEKSAEQDNLKAQYQLYMMYLMEDDMEDEEEEDDDDDDSDEKSFKWLTKAATYGHKKAQYDLSVLYKNGIKVEKDLEKSMEWLKKSVNKNYKIAQRSLAKIYEKQSKYEKALVWYEGASRQDDEESQMHLARLYKEVDKVKDLEQSAFWYSKAAEQGNSQAMSIIANFYANGIGFEKDLKKSVFWYQKMIDDLNQTQPPYRKKDEFNMEDKLSIENDIYTQKDSINRNMKKDEGKVIELYQKLVKKNDEKSKHRPIIHWINNKNVNKDSSQSVKSFLKIFKTNKNQDFDEKCVNKKYGHDYYLLKKPIGVGISNYEKRIKKESILLEKLAELNDTYAQFEMYKRYRFGRYNIIGQDDNKSEMWLRRAAEQGHAKAQYELSRTVGVNGEEEVKWLKKAATNGNALAQYLLSNRYKNGYLLESDMEKSIEWLKESAYNNMNISQRSLAKFYENQSKYGIALVWYENAAKQGNEEAQMHLGRVYKDVDEVKNLQKSTFWYIEAATQGDLRAIVMVVRAFSYGVGVKKNYDMTNFWYNELINHPNYPNSQYAEEFSIGPRAAVMGVEMGNIENKNIKNLKNNEKKVIQLHEKATKKNDAKSKYKLAVHYTHGKGVEKDLKKALQLIRESAEQGYVKAQERLGEIYGIHFSVDPLESLVKENDEKSYKWYKRAANSLSSYAMSKIAHAYVIGRGVKRNPKKAFTWYKRAAENGDRYSQHKIANIYAGKSDKENEIFSYEYGVETNYGQAFRWYKEAAKQGIEKAQEKIAGYYALGLDVDKDIEKAFNLYHNMAKTGNAYAQYVVGQFYVRGLGTYKDVIKGFEWFKESKKNGVVFDIDIILNNPRKYLRNLDNSYFDFIFEKLLRYSL
jgi:TPR repeat protein